MSIRKTFSKTISLPVTNDYHKGAVMQISTVLMHVYHLAFRGNLWSGIRKYKIYECHLFSKCLKFNLDLKNATKKWKNNFGFWDYCIWISIVKMSVLRTGYFSSAANVLPSSPKVLHVNKRDFFQLNFLGSDRWMW